MSDETNALLRDTLRGVFPNAKAVYDWRPRWMWQKDRVGVYFPSSRVAVEFCPTGADDSITRKWEACNEHGVSLVVLTAVDIDRGEFGKLRQMIERPARNAGKPRAVPRGRRPKTNKPKPNGAKPKPK